jgi:integrase
MLDVALLSSRPNFRFLLLNCTEVVPNLSRCKDVKTIQELLRHAKMSTTLDLYSQAVDAAKLEAQEDIALAITACGS